MLKLIQAEKSDKCVIVDEASIENLVDFSVHHEVKESKAFATYKGPKIPKEEWYKVMAFFRWTQDTYKSESQVRLYVNITERTWKAWAFPQEAKTGMSARELDNDDAKEQRKLFDDNWLYYGTIHHHCNCSAFQSGTDEANEKNQDGLHVTLGNLDKEEWDIHCRFYRKGKKFDPHLVWFWDVEEEMNDIPEWVLKAMPNDLVSNFGNRIAKVQMVTPPEKDYPFPDEWKANIVEIKTQNTGYGGLTLGYQGNGHKKKNKHGATTYRYSNDNCEPLHKRVSACWEDILNVCLEKEIESTDVELAVSQLKDDAIAEGIVCWALSRHKIDIGDLDRNMNLAEVQDGLKDLDKALAAELEKQLGGGDDQDSLQPDVKKVWSNMTDEERQQVIRESYTGGI